MLCVGIFELMGLMRWLFLHSRKASEEYIIGQIDTFKID